MVLSLLTRNTSVVHFLNACSCPHISSPLVSLISRSPPSSPSRLSTYEPNAQKFGYALEPKPKTANLCNSRHKFDYFILRSANRKLIGRRNSFILSPHKVMFYKGDPIQYEVFFGGNCTQVNLVLFTFDFQVSSSLYRKSVCV